jgi:hypothetical protein
VPCWRLTRCCEKEHPCADSVGQQDGDVPEPLLTGHARLLEKPRSGVVALHEKAGPISRLKLPCRSSTDAPASGAPPRELPGCSTGRTTRRSRSAWRSGPEARRARPVPPLAALPERGGRARRTSPARAPGRRRAAQGGPVGSGLPERDVDQLAGCRSCSSGTEPARGMARCCSAAASADCQSLRRSSYRTIARGRARVHSSVPNIMFSQPAVRVTALVAVP